MKTASISDLRYRFSELEARLRRGETIQVYKRKALICTLVPPVPAARIPVSELEEFRRRVWAKQPPKLTASQLIREDRDRRF